MDPDNFTCGVCQRPAGPGTLYRRVRLAAADFANNAALPVKQKPGLYACCERCWRLFLPAVAARLGQPESEVTDQDAS